VNFEFRPEARNLLIGANGSGKSTVFGVLIALQDLLVHGRPVAEAFPTVNLTAWEHDRSTQTIEMDLTGPQGAYRYQLLVEHDRARDAARIRREELVCDGVPLFRCDNGHIDLFGPQGVASSFPVTLDGSFLAVLEPQPGDERLAWFKRFLDEVVILRPDVHLIRGETAREEARLLRDGSNFPSWYRNLVQEQAEVIAEMNQELREVIEGFRSLRVEGPAGRRRELVASFAADGTKGGYTVPLFELSDGQILLLILYSLAFSLRRGGRLVCLDEPDNYVALVEIQPWLARMRGLAEESDSQLLVISHHPEVIDDLSPDAVWEFSRPSAGPSRVERFAVDRTKGLSAAEWIRARGRGR
jgi:energy-coupling factor transporter ATP-binding protein EcfA2